MMGEGYPKFVDCFLNVGGHVNSGSAIVMDCDLHVKELVGWAADDRHFSEI